MEKKIESSTGVLLRSSVIEAQVARWGTQYCHSKYHYNADYNDRALVFSSYYFFTFGRSFSHIKQDANKKKKKK